ncbi:MAG: MerR family transcriptional regulator [Firmicutes bacterium]|nr:MerR family transcriptional regulator [Bacillota bacterium]
MGDFEKMTIKKFSHMTGVSQYTLRYYDRIGLFSPADRGDNQYRYYLPHQIITLNFVKTLVDLGVPLAKIKQLSDHRTPGDVQAVLRERIRELDEELFRIQNSYQVINERLQIMQEGIFANFDEISVHNKPTKPIILGPEINWSETATFYEPFRIFKDHATKNGVNLNYTIGGFYKNFNTFLRNPGQPTRFYSTCPRGGSKISAGNYLTAFHKGYYCEMGDTPERMSAYASDSGLELSGPVYIIYPLDEICVGNRKDYVCETFVLAK